ncbi:hypothetical protein [uncultured Draconibacterium sp.]|uniref:hypothetical protein n=1 Tax=uncultured Draconibacterium sp. TaxID=1573823 RepID=UPI00326110F2
MGLEDFENLIRQQEALEAHYKELYKGFSAQFPSALNQVVFSFLPKMAANKLKFTPLLTSIAKKYIREIWEEYNFCCSYNVNGGPMPDLNPVDTISDLENRQAKRRSKLLPQFPVDYHKELEEHLREDFKREKNDLLFKLAVHEEMKAVFNAYYIDDIMEFESHVLRQFERGVYLMCALRYVDEVYTLNNKERKV